MIMKLSEALRNSMANAIRDRIDAAGPGVLRMYTGDMPTHADGWITAQQRVLATLTFENPSAPDSEGGALVFAKIAEDSKAAETGSATWARIEDGAGNRVFDCDVGGGPESGAMIVMNTQDVVQGGLVRINEFALMVPTETREER